MPRTKREGIFYGVVMAFTMSIFMNLLNTFLHAGVSMESLERALLLQPVIFAIVMVVEGLLVSNLTQKAMKRFVQAKDSTEAHALARTVCMVHGDRHVAGNEFDWTCTGGHASIRVASTFRCYMAG